MQAEFHRTDASGGYAVIVRRDDGLTVRLPGYDAARRVPHDLAHFVAEREFRLIRGVFGSIAAGAMFSNMAVVGGRARLDTHARSRAVLRAHTPDLGLAEAVSGVVHRAVEQPAPFPEVMADLAGAWGSLRAGPCPFRPETLRRTLVILAGLAQRWAALAEGGRLTLRWPLPTEPVPRRQPTGRYTGAGRTGGADGRNEAAAARPPVVSAERPGAAGRV
jgi:hypothetical protein